MSDYNRKIEDKSRQAKETDCDDMTVAERWNAMWQLTIKEYAEKGIDITKQKMRKDIVRLRRLQDE